MRPGQVLGVLALVLAGGLLAANASRFVGTKPQPRMKALDMLPTPVVARALALGQPTAAAKLRWIDSFAYFQLQMERLDDRVAGSDPRGGFERLYDTLVSLDPYFMPFYEHAVLTTGGVLSQPRVALAVIMRGLLAWPTSTQLWRMGSAELAVSFAWAKREPAKLDRWLDAWIAAEETEDGKYHVRRWRRGLAFANLEGLETLPYWVEQLGSTAPGTPLATFVEDTIRELLAQHGMLVLAEVCHPPDPLLPLPRLELDPERIAARWPAGPPPYAPVQGGPGAWTLRPDPYGWDWRRSGERVVSPGWEQQRFAKRVQAMRMQVLDEANRRGRPPRDLDEAREWGFDLPAPPDGGHWELRERLPDLRWPEPPHPPWALR